MHSYLEQQQRDAAFSLGMGHEGSPSEHLGSNGGDALPELKTPTRASSLCSAYNLFELPAVIQALSVPRQPVASKTLLKADDLRIVLTVLKKGAKMSEHHADARISLQVLSGAVRFRAGEHSQELRAGSLVTLEPAIVHAIEALESSTLLTTLAWPPGSTLRSIPHRGYS